MKSEHYYDYESENPAIYVGTYHKYNCGSIQGEWVDLTTFCDYDEFIEYCHKIHEDEKDPEFMFQDFENFPREYYSESCFSEEIFDKIIQFSEYEDKEEFKAFVEAFGIEEIEYLECRRMGEWNDEEDFARHIVDECYDLERTMGSLSYYFDYKAFAQDLFSYDYVFEGGYVFSRN